MYEIFSKEKDLLVCSADSIPSINSGCCISDIQAMNEWSAFKSYSFDSLHNWRADLIENASTTVGTLYTWEGL